MQCKKVRGVYTTMFFKKELISLKSNVDILDTAKLPAGSTD